MWSRRACISVLQLGEQLLAFVVIYYDLINLEDWVCPLLEKEKKEKNILLLFIYFKFPFRP